MKQTQFFRFLFLFTVLCLTAATGFAQDKFEVRHRDFCADNNNYSDKAAFREVRESTIHAGDLNVDARRNGGVSVRGENRSDILVRACIQTRADTDDAARTLAKSVRVETGATVHAESGSSDESNWSVSYQILVPRATNLNLITYNGGIGIEGVDGMINFEASNGGVSISDVAGTVKGRTTNGGVNVRLTGTGWKGSGLDVETTNGGVHLAMPDSYAAHIETGTVNGGFRSDISALAVDKNERGRATRISTDLNGGGPSVRVVTTNGGVKISSESNGKS
jgi:hypothetical protein